MLMEVRLDSGQQFVQNSAAPLLTQSLIISSLPATHNFSVSLILLSWHKNTPQTFSIQFNFELFNFYYAKMFNCFAALMQPESV